MGPSHTSKYRCVSFIIFSINLQEREEDGIGAAGDARRRDPRARCTRPLRTRSRTDTRGRTLNREWRTVNTDILYYEHDLCIYEHDNIIYEHDFMSRVLLYHVCICVVGNAQLGTGRGTQHAHHVLQAGGRHLSEWQHAYVQKLFSAVCSLHTSLVDE